MRKVQLLVTTRLREPRIIIVNGLGDKYFFCLDLPHVAKRIC